MPKVGETLKKIFLYGASTKLTIIDANQGLINAVDIIYPIRGAMPIA